ncbi:uncharacterized protein TRUGW13939_06976 [Talaromyces rugulosus]|uniref:Uncharacterized protein n=1 Tax=Talaromyces rugulosus TaxID=121627 RepID=A0A7H8R0B4_TALRU|nr:uncharacterized protein TRUGW13939_06976 [Talaromyces rugulosus]QKX59834.1 hypothetical protein TRUGW13939_06976 [Talaromyces rugulosus]
MTYSVDGGFPAPLETTSPAAAANSSTLPMMATTMKRKRKNNAKSDPFRVQKLSSSAPRLSHQNENPMLLRNDTELVSAAKALREDIEKIDDEFNAMNRVKKILQDQISKLDKRLNQLAPSRRGQNKR